MENEVLLESVNWINAGGMFLIFTGIALLIAEFFIPSFGLFGFSGAAAILIGVVQLHQTGYIEDMPISIEGLMFLAGIGIILSMLGGWYGYKLYKKRVTTGTEAMIGRKAEIIDWKDQKGRVIVFGENWQAYSDEKTKFKKGDNVIIAKVDNLKIKIIPDTSKESEGLI